MYDCRNKNWKSKTIFNYTTVGGHMKWPKRSEHIENKKHELILCNRRYHRWKWYFWYDVIFWISASHQRFYFHNSHYILLCLHVILITTSTSYGGESSAFETADSQATEDAASQTASEQQKETRENDIRGFGAANEKKSAPPPAIDTTSLKHLSYNNSLTSPMTPMTGKSGNSFSPSGAFQSLNLDSSANESDEEMDNEDTIIE